ncbi:hypothetical protein [Streptomyces olivaceus]|uniref:hypothetical protein n=1 Tax=Streptomyces olivaceus TaxID=47716 RepID=UPI0036EEA712
MAVTTHTPPPGAPGAYRTTGSGTETRLPWWALALPVLAFMTLLLLILNPADAQAAAEQPGIVLLLERLQQLILR